MNLNPVYIMLYTSNGKLGFPSHELGSSVMSLLFQGRSSLGQRWVLLYCGEISAAVISFKYFLVVSQQKVWKRNIWKLSNPDDGSNVYIRKDDLYKRWS